MRVKGWRGGNSGPPGPVLAVHTARERGPRLRRAIQRPLTRQRAALAALLALALVASLTFTTNGKFQNMAVPAPSWRWSRSA
ncbi:hypothetical protein HOK021_47600 [Streptomyces hygroscopicus]|nr:hypothetical protein HOK021_47600 [Streptomyces hygroscopicus]